MLWKFRTLILRIFELQSSYSPVKLLFFYCFWTKILGWRMRNSQGIILSLFMRANDQKGRFSSLYL